MWKLTLEDMSRAAGVKVNANMRSVKLALDKYGPAEGLNRPHRLAHYLAQVMTESGDFRWDRELWTPGKPTKAQAKYDTRTDLGNTPAADGDGYKNRGRGPLQVTGGYNIAEFEKWCSKRGYNPPDFSGNPDLINTDPWEGLSAIWYWTTRGLNKYADENNIEMITRRINGGLNGYPDRLENYDHVALVMLGYTRTDVATFQIDAKKAGTYTGELDGESGPKTRAAMHMMLVALDGRRSQDSPTVSAAPVVEKQVTEVPVDKPVAVVPKDAEKRRGVWGWGLTGIGSALTTMASGFMDLPWQAKVAVGAVGLASFVFLIWKGEMIVRRVKSIVEEIGK